VQEEGLNALASRPQGQRGHPCDEPDQKPGSAQFWQPAAISEDQSDHEPGWAAIELEASIPTVEPDRQCGPGQEADHDRQ